MKNRRMLTTSGETGTRLNISDADVIPVGDSWVSLPKLNQRTWDQQRLRTLPWLGYKYLGMMRLDEMQRIVLNLTARYLRNRFPLS
jgi:hypothetical protein